MTGFLTSRGEVERAQLTDEQLNIALCEWLGFSNITTDGRFGHRDDLCGEGDSRCSLPNHTEDLRAVHLAEAKLEPFEWSDYTMNLRRVIQQECNKQECYVPGTDRSQLIADFWFYHATAKQRATAILRVVKPALFATLILFATLTCAAFAEVPERITACPKGEMRIVSFTLTADGKFTKCVVRQPNGDLRTFYFERPKFK